MAAWIGGLQRLRIRSAANSVDRSLQLVHEPLGSRAQSIGFGLGKGTVQARAERREKGRDERQPQRMHRKMQQRPTRSQAEEPDIDTVHPMQQRTLSNRDAMMVVPLSLEDLDGPAYIA